ncbi:unnamed protein product [Heligmosomoides polygyrus]|uniref:RUN domain-containing protein n=1 Tax=Heligmosomoides polygyrus TaxID=6339 RepID=A0A183GPH2_HELPZ|nr:unnamed protein product [Heligmosomoides polygyrus]
MLKAQAVYSATVQAHAVAIQVQHVDLLKAAFCQWCLFSLLRRHERHLCWLALSRLESSHALAQLLSELHDQDSMPTPQSSSQLCA